MKKMKKVLMILLMVVMVGGCNNNKGCNCPDNTTSSEEKYTSVVTDYSELYNQTVQSVVLVRVQNKNNMADPIATGSGVVFFEEGENAYVLTNAHVIRGVTTDYEVEVLFSDSKGFYSGESEIATIIGRDFYEDVAVLEINKSEKYKVATMGDSDTISRGDFVYTIGSPLGEFNYTTSGNISTYNYEIGIDNSNTGTSTNVYMILFDAPINEGNSGGALFNDKGEVIGITTLKRNDQYGFFGALPINYFVKVARYLITNNGNYPRPTLNLTLLSVAELGVRKDTYGISNYVTSGLFVQTSTEATIQGGETVGIQGGASIITEINGKVVKTRADFYSEILKYNVGTTIALTVVDRTGYNPRTVNVTLHI